MYPDERKEYIADLVEYLNGLRKTKVGVPPTSSAYYWVDGFNDSIDEIIKHVEKK